MKKRFQEYKYTYCFLHNPKLDNAVCIGSFIVPRGTSWDDVANIQDELMKELHITINECWRTRKLNYYDE
jgi:hypothetical protein